MPDDFKGTVYRKNQMGDYKLVKEEQLSTFIFREERPLVSDKKDAGAVAQAGRADQPQRHEGCPLPRHCRARHARLLHGHLLPLHSLPASGLCQV